MQLEPALVNVHHVLENVPVAGGLLNSGAVVAVKRQSDWEVMYPPDFDGLFLPENENIESLNECKEP